MNTFSWYSDKPSLDSPDTIHQILALGTLDDIKELRKKIGEKKLRNIFLSHPKKVYHPQSLSFVKHFILHITDPVDDNKYLKSTLRHTR